MYIYICLHTEYVYTYVFIHTFVHMCTYTWSFMGLLLTGFITPTVYIRPVRRIINGVTSLVVGSY